MGMARTQWDHPAPERPGRMGRSSTRRAQCTSEPIEIQYEGPEVATTRPGPPVPDTHWFARYRIAGEEWEGHRATNPSAKAATAR